MGESLVRLQVAAGDERRQRFHALSRAIAEDEAAAEAHARLLLRAEREGWTELLQRSVREDLAKALNRLDVMRAQLRQMQEGQ